MRFSGTYVCPYFCHGFYFWRPSGWARLYAEASLHPVLRMSACIPASALRPLQLTRWPRVRQMSFRNLRMKSRHSTPSRHQIHCRLRPPGRIFKHHTKGKNKSPVKAVKRSLENRENQVKRSKRKRWSQRLLSQDWIALQRS